MKLKKVTSIVVCAVCVGMAMFASGHASNHSGTFVNVGTCNTITFVSVLTSTSIAADIIGTFTKAGMAWCILSAFVNVVTCDTVTAETGGARAIETAGKVVTDRVVATVVRSNLALVNVGTSKDTMDKVSFIAGITSAVVMAG